jgi:hypothetical protein
MKLNLNSIYSLLDFTENYRCKFCNTLNPFICWNDKLNDPNNPAGSFSCKACDLWLTLNKEGRIETMRYGAISCLSWNNKDKRIYNIYITGNSIAEDIKIFDTDDLDKYLLLI